MATMMEERTRLQGQPVARPAHQDTVSPHQSEGGALPSLFAWLCRAGEFVLGIVLTLAGLLVQVTLAVCVVVAPFVALALVVLLFALVIEGAGLLFRAGLVP